MSDDKISWAGCLERKNAEIEAAAERWSKQVTERYLGDRAEFDHAQHLVEIVEENLNDLVAPIIIEAANKTAKKVVDTIYGIEIVGQQIATDDNPGWSRITHDHRQSEVEHAWLCRVDGKWRVSVADAQDVTPGEHSPLHAVHFVAGRWDRGSQQEAS